MRNRILITLAAGCFLLVSSMDYTEEQEQEIIKSETLEIVSKQKAYTECLRLVEEGELPHDYECE